MREKLKRLISLPALPTLILIAVTVFLLAKALSQEPTPWYAYLVYPFSVYTLITAIDGAVRLFRYIARRLINSSLAEKFRNSALGQYLQRDPYAMSKISLYWGVFINAVYVIIKLAAGIHYHSAWFITVGVYYIGLTAMRFSLSRYILRNELKEDIPAEYRRYRICGILLLLMNLPLTGMVILIVHQNRGANYAGILIYAMAAWVFYSWINATRNIFRFRKHGSPVLSATKAVSLTAALVSVLSLETAMISQFGGTGQETFRFLMTSVSGGVICVLVLGMAIYMIVNATKKLR